MVRVFFFPAVFLLFHSKSLKELLDFLLCILLHLSGSFSQINKLYAKQQHTNYDACTAKMISQSIR